MAAGDTPNGLPATAAATFGAAVATGTEEPAGGATTLDDEDDKSVSVSATAGVER